LRIIQRIGNSRQQSVVSSQSSVVSGQKESLSASEDCHHEEGFDPTRDLLFARTAGQHAANSRSLAPVVMTIFWFGQGILAPTA
jgi:hypothetical protein